MIIFLSILLTNPKNNNLDLVLKFIKNIFIFILIYLKPPTFPTVFGALAAFGTCCLTDVLA